MQIHNIRKIANSIKKKSQIIDFMESELFKEFPDEIQEGILNKKRENITLAQFRIFLFEGLFMVAKKYSNKDLVKKAAEFFNNTRDSITIIEETDLVEIEIDDYEQLKEDLRLFFNKMKKLYSISELILTGWNEFCLNQGITREVPINTYLLNLFNIEKYEIVEFHSRSIDLLKPLFDFFNSLKKCEIALILIGNSLWKLSIEYFNKLTRYRILPHNGIFIILAYYNGVIIILKEFGMCKKIQNVRAIGDLYFQILDTKECRNFLIEPWREIF